MKGIRNANASQHVGLHWQARRILALVRGNLLPRPTKPFAMTKRKTQSGLQEVVRFIGQNGLLAA